MGKIKYIMLVFIIGCNSSQVVDEIQIVKEFNEKEKFRIWKTEKNYNEVDIIYSEEKSFKAFDSLDRVINENNLIFYTYNLDNQIVTEQSIHIRDGIVKSIIMEYKYDGQGNLETILRIGEPNDTIQKFKYDENNQIVELKNRFKEISYKYEKGQLVEKILLEKNTNRRISNFIYDDEGRLIIKNWVFNGNHKMKTTFEYDDMDRLISEIDSSYEKSTSPNTVVEFRTDYKYNSDDLIIEKISLDRVASKIEFKYNGRITCEYE